MSQRPVSVRTRCFYVFASACLGIGVLGASSEGHLDREHAPAISGARRGGEDLVVSLGTEYAVRGDTALMPLAAFLGDVKAAKIVSEITFPTAVLSFEGTEAVFGEDAGITVRAAVVPDSKSLEFGILRVEVESQAGLPEGTLVKVKFKVSSDARGGTVALKHTTQATTVGGKNIELAAAKDGQIKVAEIAVYSCFFYMH